MGYLRVLQLTSELVDKHLLCDRVHEGPQLWRIKSAQDFKINAGTDFVYKVFEIITILKSLDMYVHPCAINFHLSKKFKHVFFLFNFFKDSLQ